MEAGDPIKFTRHKDYVFVQDLGRGACGRTVLLQDPLLEENFVCKKFQPIEHSDELFNNFIREIKLLHCISHRNLVRIFNYHLYPETKTGYIVMEYVKGKDIQDFIASSPDSINDLFTQTISGFSHLADQNILHRDIRIPNMLVDEHSTVKIIDFGFGKKITTSSDFGKSISLNWWCEPPDEFDSDTYDFKTEVYFIGKLFEKLILENKLSSFKYQNIILKMCQKDPLQRYYSFNEVQSDLSTTSINEINFSTAERNSYKTFSAALINHTSKISNSIKYNKDIEKVIASLEEVYQRTMLEDFVPSVNIVIRCFMDGVFYYNKNSSFTVTSLKDFIRLLKTSTREKQNIIMQNVFTKLDTISRYDELPDPDVPF